MARIKGQANYASNFEVLKQAPLDSRTVVSEAGDLTKIATWQDADGNVWLYDGLIVVVPNADNANAPEVYVLKDKDNYGRPDAWLKLGADNASEVAAIQEALKKKANLANGKVPANELPIVTSFNAPGDITIPSSRLVNENIQAVKSNLETEINNKVVGLLHWQGVKSTTSEIKAITSAKKGDVWHSNGDGSEWVCTQDITTANADAWTELGTPINLSGYYTKTEVDKKVKPLADSIGTDSDAASANGSLYARIKKNAADIVTKASNSDLAALQSKVELKANQSDINGALIQNLTTASTEADIRKAFTEVNTKTVLFPTPGSIITKLNGNNKGIVVSLSEPDATTLGRSIVVYYGDGTYTIVVKNDFTKVLVPWRKDSSLRDLYISAGAKYNEATGFYELNGLTDITEEQMRIIYEKTWGWWLHLPSLNGFGSALPRTNIPCPDYKIIKNTSGISIHAIFVRSGNDDNLEVVNLRALYTLPAFDEISVVDINYAFQEDKKLREVQGIINVTNVRYNSHIGGNIETINIKGLKVSIRFYDSQRLSKESVLYMINNSAATSAITIGLNKAVYDVMKDDADIIAALAEKTNITLIQNT